MISKNESWQDFYYDSLETTDKGRFSKVFSAYKIFAGENIEVTHHIFLAFLIKILNEERGINSNNSLKNIFLEKSDNISEKILNKVIETLEDKIENIDKTILDGLEIREEMSVLLCEKIYNDFSIDFNSKGNKYDSFGNKFIVQDILEGHGEMFYRYEFFINFLINKIKNAKNKKEIEKVPQIVSNLSNYIGGKNSRKINQLRSELMSIYKNKKI